VDFEVSEAIVGLQPPSYGSDRQLRDLPAKLRAAAEVGQARCPVTPGAAVRARWLLPRQPAAPPLEIGPMPGAGATVAASQPLTIAPVSELFGGCPACRGNSL